MKRKLFSFSKTKKQKPNRNNQSDKAETAESGIHVNSGLGRAGLAGMIEQSGDGRGRAGLRFPDSRRPRRPASPAFRGGRAPASQEAARRAPEKELEG
jgi:hypothetical protein